MDNSSFDNSVLNPAEDASAESDQAYASWQRQADPTRPTVIVLGTVGHGKSNFLNRLAGKNVFASKRSVESVT